jgi:hypothetical protein
VALQVLQVQVVPVEVVDLQVHQAQVEHQVLVVLQVLKDKKVK